MVNRSKIGSSIAKGLDYLSAPLSQPFTFFTRGPTAAAQKVKQSRTKISRGDKREAAKVISTTLGSAVTIGAGVLASSPVSAVAGAGRIARGLTASQKASKAAARALFASKTGRSVATVAAVGAVTAPKTFKKVVSEPEVAKVVIAGTVNPVLGAVTAIEQGTNLIKESVLANQGGLETAGKVAGSALLAGGLIAVGPKLLGAIGNQEAPTLPVETSRLPTETIKETPIAPTNAATAAPVTPNTPPTVSLTPTRRKRTYKKKRMPSMSQRVTVNVGNKRYLNNVYVNK